ncbi:MAG: hypothetical protein ABR530_04275, partial [Pyrinomonadaceae bacterium]
LELSAWGLDPAAFGAAEETITTRVDVRQYLDQKLAALRCHKTQFGPDNLFTSLPDDLAEEFLGVEFFTRATPQSGSDHDPLLKLLSGY